MNRHFRDEERETEQNRTDSPRFRDGQRRDPDRPRTPSGQLPPRDVSRIPADPGNHVISRRQMTRNEYEALRHKYAKQKAAEMAKQRRKKFIIFAVALAAVIIAVAILIAACSGDSPDTPADTQTATELRTEAVAAPVETDPPEPEGLMKYAQTTKETKTLTTEVESDYAILIDVKSNTVIATKGGDKRIYPASMTKMLTLIVAYEHCTNLDDTFEMTADIVGTLYEENATVAGFLPGEKCTVRDMLYGLILPSGADAAWALALYTAGSVEDFAVMMNEKVAELGLKNSHFTNPTGLHDKDQYSTCHDIAKILEYASQDPFMREVLTAYTYTTAKTEQNPDGITLYSTMQGRLVGDEAPGMYILGGKTGYTDEAKNCLASYAVRYDKDTDDVDEVYTRDPEYILVTASGDGKWVPIFDAINTYATIIDPNALETRYHT